MSYLLDSHTLLWILVSTKKLSQKVKEILLDPKSTVFVSAISLWEISLKYRIGKLKLKGKTPDEIPDAVSILNFNFVNLDPVTASTYYKLPRVNRNDPFDNMIAWQAINENFTLLSKDKGFDDFQKQGLKRVW